MGASTSAAQMAGKVRAAGKALEKNRSDQLRSLGDDMTVMFDRAVSNDLTVTGTPHGFRNWVTELQAKGKVQGSDTIVFAPVGKSVGPIRVAEQGRNQKAGPVAPRFSKKTGKQLKPRKRKKWSGQTEGKGTWSDATTEIAAKLPSKIRSGFTKAAMEVFK